MRKAPILTLLLCLAAVASAAVAGRVLAVAEGADETTATHTFEAHPHWTVTLTVTNANPKADVSVFVDPQAGGENLLVAHLTGNGTLTVTIRDGGKYHLSVIGFDASWKVVAEDSP